MSETPLGVARVDIEVNSNLGAATQAAKRSLADIMGDDEVDDKCKELVDSHKQETESGGSVGYVDMLTPGHAQFHPTVITIMGQVNQALTGYGAVSVYGPQIFELLGYGVQKSEFLTQGNYISYFAVMKDMKTIVLARR